MDALVGYTGFVGSNIADKHRFDRLYNSKNISEAFGTRPDLLVYSGIPAEMFLANSNPSADLVVCENAADNIRKIAPKRLTLVSSIAAIDNPVGVDEDYAVNAANLGSYGANRYRLEQLASEIVPNCHIIRLPALFGKGIKKNFIYDLIYFVPSILNRAKYEELSAKEPSIGNSYRLTDNGFYKLLTGSGEAIKTVFERIGFSALNFTDSRSMFQFYNLIRLWEHIKIAIDNDIPLLHLATEPLSAGEIHKYVMGGDFINKTANPLHYDFRTKYAALFGGSVGYLFKKEQMLMEIKSFVNG
jgi:hypothetical protein